MSFAYNVKDQDAVHFVTFTVHQWADVFTRAIYVNTLIESFKYCQKEKGLEIFAWVVMSNHCHLIIKAKNNNLSSVIRDLKKFTSKAIYKAIETNTQESRKNWLLQVLNFENKIWFWEEGYHGEEIYTKAFFDTKVNYIHQNPVRAGIVEKEEEYLNSSAGEIYGVRESRLLLNEF
ncbi:MAG: transposase [Chitinophagaceae bacterium]|nr:MAG: transposase [Chitinophagaceae bacterium]